MEEAKGIIGSFIVVILAVAFMTAMVGLLNPQTGLSTSTNESFNISSAIIDDNRINESVVFTLDYGSATTGNTPISSVVITNGTTTATITTDYLIGTDLGNISLVNSTYMLSAGDTLYATYNYKASSYLDSSFARTTASLILGILALVVVAWLIKKLVDMFGTE